MKNYIAYPSLVCEECIGKMKVKTVSGWANGNLETYEVYEL